VVGEVGATNIPCDAPEGQSHEGGCGAELGLEFDYCREAFGDFVDEQPSWAVE